MSERFLERGDGPPLVHLVEPGGVRLAPAHERLAARFRVRVVDTVEPAALAGLAAFNLLATGRAGRTALGLAQRMGDRVLALVLESPEDLADDTLAGLAAPALLLVGTRDGRGAQRVPGAHLVFVYDAGATIADDRPDAFAEVVADFLERHDAFVISRATTVIHP